MSALRERFRLARTGSARPHPVVSKSSTASWPRWRRPSRISAGAQTSFRAIGSKALIYRTLPMFTNVESTTSLLKSSSKYSWRRCTRTSQTWSFNSKISQLQRLSQFFTNIAMSTLASMTTFKEPWACLHFFSILKSRADRVCDSTGSCRSRWSYPSVPAYWNPAQEFSKTASFQKIWENTL